MALFVQNENSHGDGVRISYGALERNHDAVIAMLAPLVPLGGTVVELGSGPGAHGAYFCRQRTDVSWIPTDLGDRFDSVRAWADYLQTPNVADPHVVNLLERPPALPNADAIFCMNTIHVAPLGAVEGIFRVASSSLVDGGIVMLYGPFEFPNEPLTPSNIAFDGWLKTKYPEGGIRSFELIDETAAGHGLRFEGKARLPANNHALWWRRPRND